MDEARQDPPPGQPQQSAADAVVESLTPRPTPPVAPPPAPCRPPKPRIIRALLVPVFAIPAAAIVGGIATIVPAMIMHWPQFRDSARDPEALQRLIIDFVSTPLGLLCSVVPAELTYLAIALLAARLSPMRWRERLAMKRPATPWWAYLLFGLATPICGMAGSLLVQSLLDVESGSGLFLYGMFQSLSPWLGVAAVLLYSIAPGFCEEMFFRGYVQSRLLKRWNPLFAIGAASLLFAIAHVELAHALLVLPLGVWLGVLAWRTGSIWASISTHTLNNMYGVSLMLLITPQQVEMLERQWTPFSVAVTVISAAAMIASLAHLFVFARNSKKSIAARAG